MDWDPHVILGIPGDATPDDIRKAYRKKARMYHPDKNPGDTRAATRFQMIIRAYNALMRPENEPGLAQYSRPEPVSAVAEAQGSFAQGSSAQVPVAEVLKSVAEGLGSFAEGLETDNLHAALNAGQAGGFNGSLESESQPMAAPPASKPRVRVVRADIDLAQVMKPGHAYLEVPGVGRVAVQIPAGADTGTVTRGIVRRENGEVEPLAVELRVRPDPIFRRRGLDLVMRYRVDAATAFGGTSTTIATPGGPVEVRIPKRSRWGDVVRIPCKGIMGGEAGWGSLFIELSRH